MLAGPPRLLAGWRRDRGANSLPRLWIKRARSLRARWSLSARGHESSTACKMTHGRCRIYRQLFGLNSEKCQNQLFKITEKCRNRHLKSMEKCRIRRSQHPEKCNRMTKRHVEAGVACGRFSSPQPSLLVVSVVGVALEGVDVQVLVVVLFLLRCRFGRGGAAE